MKASKLTILIILSISCVFLLSCEKDDAVVKEEIAVPEEPVLEEEEEEEEEQGEDDSPESPVTFFYPDLVMDHYILINNAASNEVYLINKQGERVFDWSLSNNIGNDVYLLPDGRLLASLEADDVKMALGGQGGKLQFVAADGTIEWNFDYSSEEAELHHDAELLPNGNVIAMVWEKVPQLDAEEAGSGHGMDIFVEGIIEVNPETNEIVWEWHSMDHLVQDQNPDKQNFGSVAENPNKIDLNYVTHEKGDIMHANGISYDPVNDLIFLSVNFYSEVWVIDHSTTTEEAAGSNGGNFNKGGDLVYRFGNPEAYQNPAGTRLFNNNHYPNLLTGDDSGKMLIFSNGISQSTVYELELPATYDLVQGIDNEPVVSWSFTDPELYSPKVSGAVPLPNGNVLITEGDFGLWEVTRDGKVVWQYQSPGFYWRAYHYDKDSPEINALGLSE
ncbi:aryl-sulfate sulfotransferase [Zeaxanthinibacter enoshimensis]|uniref:Arylsulfotransferase ASST n=1 Tax=Zeaxanthinibacter enoshimensis TaxID=392009 RepID=A0A4V3D3B5_9FLAO|nr:aryl-sulfate sulfotransferase [Zeaxanthinibacter enoshimensis]TDQ28984.1 arylsulfotransferase ASST [Zeaxanthinibacter enoshimensis]